MTFKLIAQHSFAIVSRDSTPRFWLVQDVLGFEMKRKSSLIILTFKRIFSQRLPIQKLSVSVWQMTSTARDA